jgi:hypothetical protein
MDPANLLTKWHWIVELARKNPGTVLFSPNPVTDFEWMREPYIRTRKDGATGIDGVLLSVAEHFNFSPLMSVPSGEISSILIFSRCCLNRHPASCEAASRQVSALASASTWETC